MIRALLVDDEYTAIRWLADLLAAFPTVQVVGTASSVAQAQSLLEDHPVDVIFLDIEMPRRTGFELFDNLDPQIRVVMVTAHDNHAIHAYYHGAFDYLLKPICAERLSLSIQRLTQLLAKPQPPQMLLAPQRILLPTPQGTALFDPDQILWILARENHSVLHRADNEPQIIKRSLSEWEQTPPAPSFVRIDRSTIVNLQRIHTVRWRTADESILEFSDTDKRLSLGRAAATRLRRLLTSYTP